MWKPIVAGIDASPAGVWAARIAWSTSTAAGVGCRLVHAVRDTWLPPDGRWDDGLPNALRRHTLADARGRLVETLKSQLPDECLDLLEVYAGRTPTVLAQIAAERDAGLIVVGGKRHTGFGRWIAGRTAHNLARMVEVPLLIARDGEPFRRILAAVDLSEVVHPTIAAAEDFARLFTAELRVLHAVEPLPSTVERAGMVDRDQYRESVDRYLEAEVWPQITLESADHVVRHATAEAAIEIEASTWRADLVVVGSHGHGWLDRLVLGSVTEALLNDLPASLLVVPVARGRARTTRSRTGAAAPERV